jgi:hypothetical protein
MTCRENYILAGKIKILGDETSLDLDMRKVKRGWTGVTPSLRDMKKVREEAKRRNKLLMRLRRGINSGHGCWSLRLERGEEDDLWEPRSWRRSREVINKLGWPRPWGIWRRRDKMGWPCSWGIDRRSREGMNSGDLVLEGYEEDPIGGIKWGDLVVGEYERGGQV